MVRIIPNRRTNVNILAVFLGLVPLGAYAQQYDPPSRVARLNYVNGNVSMEPAGVDDWAPAVVNRPYTTGDYLYTDNGAQAELHMDVAVMRMAPQTSFGFLNLNDQTVQIKLSEGEMYFRVRHLGTNEVFEVDTPNAAVNLLQNGVYKFSVDPNGNTTFVVVREGQAEVTGGGQAFTLNQGNSASLSGSDQLAYDIENDPGPDQFDNWCSQRDAREMRSRSARYVPPSMIGYEDLDDYGGWQDSQQYGAVWYPNRVDSGWAPYHDGHWAWIEPWGYTWVDDAPWGFAPFHYGRWAYIGNRWGWTPGRRGYDRDRYERPCYAPALVTFLGGAGFGLALSFGGGYHGGQGMGWVPLGYGEVYSPPYRVSQNYFRQVNVSNTTINRNVNITNVYNNVYVNKTTTNVNQTFVNMNAPGGVTAMPRDAFASGRSVRQVGLAVPQNQVARLQATPVFGTPVAPTRQAVTPIQNNAPVVRPAAQVFARQVVARSTPPPAPAAFAARQAYVQQHTGQPLSVADMRQTIARSNSQAVAAAAPAFRQAPVARPVQVQVGQRVGNPIPSNRPGMPVARQQAPNQPVPNQPNRGVPANQAPPQQQQPFNNQRPGQPVSQQQQAGRPGYPQNVTPQQAPPMQQHGLAPNQRTMQSPVQSAPPNRPTGFPAQNQPPQPQTPNQRGVSPAQNSRPVVAQPSPIQQPVPSPQQHGAPPNQRPTYVTPPQTQNNAPSARPPFESRAPQQQQAQPVRPQPAPAPSRPATPPPQAPVARPQAAPQPPPEYRQQRPTERPVQPAPEPVRPPQIQQRPAPEPVRPQMPERPMPTPVRPQVQERPAPPPPRPQVQERPAPPPPQVRQQAPQAERPRSENRPAAPEPHGTPPKPQEKK